VDWLLKSIENQSPEEVQQYKLLQSKNPLNAIDLTGNKRARESDSDDEDVGSLKKPKDERKIRFAKLAALVDSEIDTDGGQLPLFLSFRFETWLNHRLILGRTLSVWMDDAGEIWDATLMNTVTIKGSQATSIIRLQLIFDSNSDKYYVFQAQREIPTTRDEPSITTHEEFCDTLDGARCDFEGKFRSQSGLLWKNRREIPKDDRFVSLELQYEEPVILVSEKCAFAQSVENVLSLIFQKGDFERFVNSMSTYGRRMELAGQFNGHTLQAGIAILRKIVELYGKIAMKSCGPQVNNLCNLYSVLMVNGAQNFTYNQPGLAPIMGELMTLDLAIKLHTASNILRGKNSKLNTSMTMRQISHALGLAKLTPGEKTSCSSRLLLLPILNTSINLTFSSGSNFKGICGAL
jgi:poly [ADP-ribose] polymerase